MIYKIKMLQANRTRVMSGWNEPKHEITNVGAASWCQIAPDKLLFVFSKLSFFFSLFCYFFIIIFVIWVTWGLGGL